MDVCLLTRSRTDRPMTNLYGVLLIYDIMMLSSWDIRRYAVNIQDYICSTVWPIEYAPNL